MLRFSLGFALGMTKVDRTRNEYISSQRMGHAQSENKKIKLIWTCMMERYWVYWETDIAEERLAKQEGKRKGKNAIRCKHLLQ